MTAASLVAAGRTLAATLMPDTATITREGGEMVFDAVSGELTPAAGVVVYNGRCRVRTPPGVVEREVLFGESQVTTTRFAVTIPYDSAEVVIDDVVTVTESDDPHIGNRTFRVVFVPSATYLMYRDLGVEATE